MLYKIFPKKYAIIPPMYEAEARKNKNSQGVADLALQAIKISGGSNPKTVSENKKNARIICGE